jgi:hypothetical protein
MVQVVRRSAWGVVTESTVAAKFRVGKFDFSAFFLSRLSSSPPFRWLPSSIKQLLYPKSIYHDQTSGSFFWLLRWPVAGRDSFIYQQATSCCRPTRRVVVKTAAHTKRGINK